nr:hypothetical protein [Tanacetum cinerariifolium]
MTELCADAEFKDTIMVAMLKLVGEGFNMCTMRVEYECKLFRGGDSSLAGKGVASSSTSSTPVAKMIDKFERQLTGEKLLLVDDDEKPLPKVVSTVNADIDSEMEEVLYEHITFMASTSLKRCSDTSYDTNSLWEQWRKTKQNDDYDPYDDDIQLTGEKLLLVDDDEKPLPKVVSTVNADIDSEMEEVLDEHTTFMASTSLKRCSDTSYGTNSLWKQWKKTKRDDDYDPYDDDMYDSHDMSNNFQAICDEFDITVRDRKNK